MNAVVLSRIAAPFAGVFACVAFIFLGEEGRVNATGLAAAAGAGVAGILAAGVGSLFVRRIRPLPKRIFAAAGIGAALLEAGLVAYVLLFGDPEVRMWLPIIAIFFPVYLAAPLLAGAWAFSSHAP